jgi:hypothetical protein
MVRVSSPQSSNESSNADELGKTDANCSVHIGPGYPNLWTGSDSFGTARACLVRK